MPASTTLSPAWAASIMDAAAAQSANDRSAAFFGAHLG